MDCEDESMKEEGGDAKVVNSDGATKILGTNENGGENGEGCEDRTQPVEWNRISVETDVQDNSPEDFPISAESLKSMTVSTKSDRLEDHMMVSSSGHSDSRIDLKEGHIDNHGNSPQAKNATDHTEPEKPQESSDTSGVAEGNQPSCSTSKFHKLKSKVKKRHYRKRSTDVEDVKSKEKKARENRERSSSPIEHERTRRSSESERDDRVSLSSDQKSSTSNSDNEDGNSSEWTTASEDEFNGGVPRVLQKDPPKPKMFIVQEMINRQIGNSRLFERKFYGSLHVVQRLELMQKMEEHEECVNALNFNRQGNLLASASDDLRVVIWDWAIGKKRHAFETGHKSNVFESKWLPLDFENYVATCARDGQVRLLDICTGTHRKLASHHGPARRLGIHADHPHTVLSVGDDAKVLSIDIRGGKATKLQTVKEGRSDMYLYSIHINPRNSHQYCVGGRSQVVKIYDRRKGSTALQRLCPDNLTNDSDAHVTCALYNYNGTEIIASYNDDDIYLFDAVILHPSGDFAHRYEGHRNNATVKSVNFFGPQSEFIVSGSDCGNIFFWDKNTEAIVQWFPGDEEGIVNRLECHPNVPILATSGLDHDVKIWIPSYEQAPQMNKLEDCVKTNLRNRANDVSAEPDAFDGQMLTVFLQHIRQNEGFSGFFSGRSRFVMRAYDDNSDSSSEAGSVHSDSSSEGRNEGPQCAPS